MGRNKDIGKRCCSVADIRPALKHAQQLPNQSIDCRRIIVIQNFSLVIVAFPCVNGCLIRLIINNKRWIFCWNFLFSVYNLCTMIFTEKPQNFTQNRCILFGNHHKWRHHGYAFRFFIDITFFIPRCNRLNNSFNLIMRTYTNTYHIAFPCHISDVFETCFISKNFFIDTRLCLTAKAVVNAR